MGKRPTATNPSAGAATASLEQEYPWSITTAAHPGRGLSTALWDGFTPAILPNVENSGVKFMVAEHCVRAILLNLLTICEKEGTYFAGQIMFET